MQLVNVKGYGVVPFSDDISVDEIRATLRRRYTDLADNDLLQGASEYGAPTGNVAAPYNPSLMERTAQGVGGALYDSGIISNRAGAQQIGKNVTSIGELLPGIGDVAAVDDTIRAYDKGNYGEAALNAVGVVPLLGDAAIFAGVLAKNADLGALRKAKLLEDTGADRNRIWKETGWVNDNGDWKFEIDDSASKGNPYREYSTVKGYLKHDELYNQYPDVGDIHTRVDDELGPLGSYNEWGGGYSEGIRLKQRPDFNKPKSTLLHETQHAIQQREGFAKGGSPELFSPKGEYRNRARKRMDAIKKEKPALAKAFADYNSKEEALNAKYGRDVDKWPDEIAEKYYIDSDKLLGMDGGEEMVTLSDNIYDPPQSELEKMPSAMDQYQRLAGEAEARNVQTRMNMTPDERRAKPPWETLDVPEDELIYRGGSGVSKSQAPVDVASSIKPAFKANQGAANMDAMLDLLKPKGQTANIGFEKGAVKKDGIAKFTSPNGSTRYVMMDGGEPVSALQIMSRDGKDGVISNVFTLPSNQKKGFASKLMSKAKKDFKSIKHSDELTEQGARFANSVEGTSQAPVSVASNIKPVGGKKLITNDGDEYFELPSGEIVTDLNSKDVIFKDAKEAEGYLDGLYSEGSYKYNAVQQGYTGEIKGTKAKKNKLYHGTSDDIESFDKSKLQTRDDGAIGTGVYVTSSPKIAESYANTSPPRFKSDKTGDYVEPNIIPISTRAKKTKIFSLAEKLDFMKEMNSNRNFSKELTKKLKKEGYDSSAVVDVNGDLIEMNIFEPEMVRASHAKFDPKNKGSASLLGGLGALGVGVGSRSRSDEEYE